MHETNKNFLISQLTKRYPRGILHVEDRMSDDQHLKITLVDHSFEATTRLQRHREIFGAISSRIESERLHALSIKAYTPAEWEKHQKTSLGED